MLTISGVYAEDIDSSVAVDCPVSADEDICLSSCDALNNELSNSYEPSEVECYDSPQDIQPPKATVEKPIGHESNSVVYENDDEEGINIIPVIGLDDLSQDDVEGIYVPVVSLENIDQGDWGDVYIPLIDFDSLDGESLYIPVICLDDANQGGLECIYVPVVIENVSQDDIEVILKTQTSESYNLIGDVTQVVDLLKFENVSAVLAINVTSVPVCYASEPVFDGILLVFGYISDDEVYFGSISLMSCIELLESAGAENTLLFASLANGYCDVTFDGLEKLAAHGQIGDDILGYTVTKALLLYIEDNHDNSHDLEKHVNLLSTSSRSATEDVLGVEIHGETSLDHKAKWTPLLLLQANLTGLLAASQTDDKKKNSTNGTDDNNTNSSNKSHHKGRHYHRHWRHHGGGCVPPVREIAPDLDLDNSSDDKENETNSTNATVPGETKHYDSPKTSVRKDEPTYTLVYAIIGIILVSILFNNNYLKDD